MLVGILWALLAGLMLGLYAIPGKYTKDFKEENTWGLFCMLTMYVVPDCTGNREDITCGFDSLNGYFSEAYKANSPYFGCIVGRYAARIKDGLFTVDGQQYQVAKNDGPNHLHGGITGFDKRVWDAETSEEADASVLRLTLVSPDGEEGYPGTEKESVSLKGIRDADKADIIMLLG